MQDYRAYILAEDGHVQNRVDLRCGSETEAVRLAKQLVDGHDVELWQLDRKIETFRSRQPRAANSRPVTLRVP
jgi:hypothetical protein